MPRYDPGKDTRRTGDLPDHQRTCKDPKHETNKSKWTELSPGMYEHQCPKCLKKVSFVIRKEN